MAAAATMNIQMKKNTAMSSSPVKLLNSNAHARKSVRSQAAAAAQRSLRVASSSSTISHSFVFDSRLLARKPARRGLSAVRATIDDDVAKAKVAIVETTQKLKEIVEDGLHKVEEGLVKAEKVLDEDYEIAKSKVTPILKDFQSNVVEGIGVLKTSIDAAVPEDVKKSVEENVTKVSTVAATAITTVSETATKALEGTPIPSSLAELRGSPTGKDESPEVDLLGWNFKWPSLVFGHILPAILAFFLPATVFRYDPRVALLTVLDFSFIMYAFIEPIAHLVTGKLTAVHKFTATLHAVVIALLLPLSAKSLLIGPKDLLWLVSAFTFLFVLPLRIKEVRIAFGEPPATTSLYPKLA